MKGIIIDKGEKFYTNLKDVLETIGLENYKHKNWLISSYECFPRDNQLINLFSGKPVFMSGERLMSILEKENFQWIWGVFSAFDTDIEEERVLGEKVPYADGNASIWEGPASIQHPLATIEIIAWDSSLTVIICKDENIIEKIKKNKEQAIELEDYLA